MDWHFGVMCGAHGQGHREAHPAALADLLPHGGTPPGDASEIPPRRRGVLGDERGCVRAPVLCRPRGARGARGSTCPSTSPPRPTPIRRTTRCGRRTSISPPSSSPSGARRPGLRPHAARRRVRLRRAAAARAAAAHLGAAEPAERTPISGRSRLASRLAPEGPELSQRSRKIETAIFRQKTILFDYFTIDRDETEKRKVLIPTPCSSGRPLLPRRLRPRA